MTEIKGFPHGTDKKGTAVAMFLVNTTKMLLNLIYHSNACQTLSEFKTISSQEKSFFSLSFENITCRGNKKLKTRLVP